MLLIDQQKGSDKLVAMFPPEMTKRSKLGGGDVCFFGWGPEGRYTWPIGIEYKTAQDALQCMIDGRLAGEQLVKMTEQYRRIYLLIEGEYSERHDGVLQFRTWRNGKPSWESFSAVTYRQFDNWLNSLTESVKITIKRSLTRPESAAQILDLYHLWSAPYDKHKSCLRFDKSHIPTLLTRPTVKRLIAAQIPGVGWELSDRAAKHFTNVVELVNADVESWTQINGIGKIKAQKIYSSLRE